MNWTLILVFLFFSISPMNTNEAEIIIPNIFTVKNINFVLKGFVERMRTKRKEIKDKALCFGYLRPFTRIFEKIHFIFQKYVEIIKCLCKTQYKDYDFLIKISYILLMKCIMEELFQKTKKCFFTYSENFLDEIDMIANFEGKINEFVEYLELQTNHHSYYGYMKRLKTELINNVKYNLSNKNGHSFIEIGKNLAKLFILSYFGVMYTFFHTKERSNLVFHSLIIIDLFIPHLFVNLPLTIRFGNEKECILLDINVSFEIMNFLLSISSSSSSFTLLHKILDYIFNNYTRILYKGLHSLLQINNNQYINKEILFIESSISFYKIFKIKKIIPIQNFLSLSLNLARNNLYFILHEGAYIGSHLIVDNCFFSFSDHKANPQHLNYFGSYDHNYIASRYNIQTDEILYFIKGLNSKIDSPIINQISEYKRTTKDMLNNFTKCKNDIIDKDLFSLIYMNSFNDHSFGNKCRKCFSEIYLSLKNLLCSMLVFYNIPLAFIEFSLIERNHKLAKFI